MIDFSGFGCVNCRKMEASVWTDPKVKQMLENDYVLITLMVDDKTKLPQPIEIQENGKTRKLKTIGDKWSYLQRSKFGSNAQPFYILLNDEGQPLGPSYAFNEDCFQIHPVPSKRIERIQERTTIKQTEGRVLPCLFLLQSL